MVVTIEAIMSVFFKKYLYTAANNPSFLYYRTKNTVIIKYGIIS